MSSMASGHHHNHASFYIGHHHHRAHSRSGEPLIEVEAIEEGLDYGSDRSPMSMAHSLGHTARSTLNSASTGTIAFTGRAPHPYVAPHPVPAASTASNTSWRNALSRRRSSDVGMAIQQPHVSATYPNFLAVPSTAAVGAGRRNSTPATVVPLSGSSRDDRCFRSTSYEEELELRLEHVRLRAVDAERRLAAERLKRRRAAQRIAELERQHVEKTNSLIAEADRRADRLRARCEQVREECRRREVEAEKQCAEISDKFQTRLRKIEEQLVEALRCQKVDASQLCDASTQTKDSSFRSPLPSIAATKDTQDKSLLGKEKRRTVADDLDGHLTTFLTPTDNVWISLYDMVATLAFSRVRYLESLTLTGKSSSRVPTKRTGKYTQFPYPLRNCQRPAVRRRYVGGGDTPSAATPSERQSIESLLAIPPSPTATPRLRRTSSCPSQEAATVAAAASATSSSSVIRRQPSAPEASSGKITKRYTVDFSIEKSTSLTAVCDSQSVRRLHKERASALENDNPGVEPNSAKLKVGDLDACSPIASGQSAEKFNSSSDAAAALVAEQPTAQTSSSSSSASNKPKRLSSLNLEDIFRKLQTGVHAKGRRADRDRERVQGMLTTSNGDSSNADAAELARKSLSPRHRSTSLMSRSQSTGSDSLEKNYVQNSPTRCVPVRAVHGQLFARRSVGLDQEADDTNIASENTSFTAQPEVETTARVEGNEFFDAESPPGDVSGMSGLRRSLPLSPRRRERTHRQASLLIEGDLLRHSTSVNLESGSATDEAAQSGKAAAVSEVETATSATNRSAPRPVSSFGRLQERRNGLTALDDSQLIAKSSLGRPTTSHSRFDNIARNIKTYLTNHSQ